MRGLQSDHFLNNGLYPGLQQGQLLGYAIDDCFVCGNIVQIGLMEHEWVMMKSEKMSRVCCLLNSQQIVPIAGGLRSIGVDPLKNCARGKLALVTLARGH
jgi:hypothetical protein